jgi:hypothetical protein
LNPLWGSSSDFQTSSNLFSEFVGGVWRALAVDGGVWRGGFSASSIFPKTGCRVGALAEASAKAEGAWEKAEG